MSLRLRILASIALLACAGVVLTSREEAAAHVQVGAEPATQTNRKLISDAFDRWAAGEGRFFDEVLSPDVIWTIEGSGPSAGDYVGLTDFMARAIQPFADRMQEPVRPVSKDIWAQNDQVIVVWEGRGRARDGAAYQNDYVWIFTLKDGRAVRVRAFLDLPAYDDVLRPAPAS